LQRYCINIADDKKVEAIYTMVEDEIAERLDIWENEEFLDELDHRLKDYESGNIECSTWEEIKQKTKSR
jgi:uncharacterized protein YmfQ (DUF2313 family)